MFWVSEDPKLLRFCVSRMFREFIVRELPRRFLESKMLEELRDRGETWFIENLPSPIEEITSPFRFEL